MSLSLKSNQFYAYMFIMLYTMWYVLRLYVLFVIYVIPYTCTLYR